MTPGWTAMTVMSCYEQRTHPHISNSNSNSFRQMKKNWIGFLSSSSSSSSSAERRLFGQLVWVARWRVHRFPSSCNGRPGVSWCTRSTATRRQLGRREMRQELTIYLLCCHGLQYDGKNGFASCAFILTWCGSIWGCAASWWTDASSSVFAPMIPRRRLLVPRGSDSAGWGAIASAPSWVSEGQRLQHNYFYVLTWRKHTSTPCQCAQARPHHLPRESPQILRLLRQQVVVWGRALRFFSVFIFKTHYVIS